MVKPVSGCYHAFDYKVQHKEVHASMSNAPDTSQAKIHCKKKICFFLVFMQPVLRQPRTAKKKLQNIWPLLLILYRSQSKKRRQVASTSLPIEQAFLKHILKFCMLIRPFFCEICVIFQSIFVGFKKKKLEICQNIELFAQVLSYYLEFSHP